MPTVAFFVRAQTGMSLGFGQPRCRTRDTLGPDRVEYLVLVLRDNPAASYG